MPDLTAIAGLAELRAQARGGDARILIAVLDGPVDLERACFQGAVLSPYMPYWQGPIAIDPQHLAAFLAIENSGASDETKAENLKAAIPDERIRGSLQLAFHATHISSTLFGQPDSPVAGIAPHCTGINIPIAYDHDSFIDPVNLTRALDAAREVGAHIIHVAACHPTHSGLAHDLLARAVRRAQDNNMLIVAPGGNDKGECWCIPAVLPGVLTVGAMKDDGQPFNFSNWGGNYQSDGVLAPGENILGAQPGTDQPIRKQGTSCAAPVVTGVAALLLSRQLQRGVPADPEAVRAAILTSATPCDPGEVKEPARCLRGRLNIPGALTRLTGAPLAGMAAAGAETPTAAPASAGVSASQRSDRVYALGTLGYDFGTEARRDSFKQRMPALEIEGTQVPANPYDARQMADYLAANPTEALNLIWTLNQELIPVYAVEPRGPFAAEVYATLQQLLAGQLLAPDSPSYIERVSLPARLTERKVKLFSGQQVAVIAPQARRGLYGLQVNALVGMAVDAVRAEHADADEARMRRSLQSFLHRVHYDLRNLGQTARDRALNFAATNAFQAAKTFAEAIARGLELETIEVSKSPFCRIDSDCWDVKLKFFDPENTRRARRVFRFTIDVADSMPVTLGEVRVWSVSR